MSIISSMIILNKMRRKNLLKKISYKKAGQQKVEDFYLYISHDFLYNLLYMMIHKKFIRIIGMDYHRITEIFWLFEKYYSKNLQKAINCLFGGIESEDEIKWCIASLGWNIHREANDYILTVNENMDNYHFPNIDIDAKKYILPCYMLRNFLQFKQLFYEVVSKKIDVGNDVEFWLYTCRYLLMGDKKYKAFGFGPDGKNFPYKLIEE